MRLWCVISLAGGVQAVRSSVAMAWLHSPVAGVQQLLPDPKPEPWDVGAAEHIVSTMVSGCELPVYVFATIKGLVLEDLRHPEWWPAIRDSIGMLSTFATFPHLDKPLDLEPFVVGAAANCLAKLIRWHDKEDWHEFKQEGEYIDTKTRVMEIQFPPLPDEGYERAHALHLRDQLIGMVLKMLPTPYHVVVIASDEVSFHHPLPDFARAEMPYTYEVFADLVEDHRRTADAERIKHVVDKPRVWNRPRHNVLTPERLAQDDERLLDFDLLAENSVVVVGAVGMTCAVVIGAVVRFSWRCLRLVFAHLPSTKHKTE